MGNYFATPSTVTPKYCTRWAFLLKPAIDFDIYGNARFRHQNFEVQIKDLADISASIVIYAATNLTFSFVFGPRAAV